MKHLKPIYSSEYDAFWFAPADKPNDMHKLGHIEAITLEPKDGEIKTSDDRVLFTSEPIELSAKILNKTGLKAFAIFALTGNDLYLKFPKKLRRKKGWR